MQALSVLVGPRSSWEGMQAAPQEFYSEGSLGVDEEPSPADFVETLTLRVKVPKSNRFLEKRQRAIQGLHWVTCPNVVSRGTWLRSSKHGPPVWAAAGSMGHWLLYGIQ